MNIYELLSKAGATSSVEDDNGKTLIPSYFKCGIGFDTESTTIFEERTKEVKDADTGEKKTITVNVITDCYCYIYQVAVGESVEFYRTSYEFFNFLKELKAAVDKYNKIYDGRTKAIIWVANLAHEWSFIKYGLTKLFKVNKYFAKSPRDILYIDLGFCEFRECIGLFGHSLADIAKNWTQTQKLKDDLDYSLTRTRITELSETEKAYCRNDVIILTEMHTAVFKAYTQDNGSIVIPYTRSGFVRLKLKNAINCDSDLTEQRTECIENYTKDGKPLKNNVALLKKKNRKLFESAEQWNICRKWGYSGGLCGSNIDFVGKLQHNIYCADLTSDYPAQFVHEKYPCGELKQVNRRKWPGVLSSGRPFFVVLQIQNIESKTHHATLSKHKVLNYKPPYNEIYGEPIDDVIYNGKIRKAKNIIVVWNDIDLKAYEMIYKITYRPLVAWQFSGYNKLPAWLINSMLEDYEKKAVLKKEGQKDTVLYRDSKSNVNTYYGVCATRPQNTYDKFVDGLFEPEKLKDFSDIKYNTWLNPYFAFWCTSYARKILMTFISKFPDNIIQYDTDSLYYRDCDELKTAIDKYNKNIIEKNQRLFKDNPHKELLLDLGTWDIEKCYVDFLPLGAKKYIKRDSNGTLTTVIAGLPKSSIPDKIIKEGIKKPFDYFNPLKRFIDENTYKIIIEHLFTGKFASVYDDRPDTYYKTITDYQGNSILQECGCYHALQPVDFTLSLAYEYLQEILNLR